MTPDKLAKSGTEHAHQVALFAWCAVAYLHGFEIAEAWAVDGPQAFKKSPRASNPDAPPAVPALEWFHAVPNGGSRGDDEQSRKIRGANLKAEGVRQGVADTFLPWPNAGWHGLYIEMKKPTERPKREGKGGVSDEQSKFGAYAKSVGYGWIVCYDWREAANALLSYIEWGKHHADD